MPDEVRVEETVKKRYNSKPDDDGLTQRIQAAFSGSSSFTPEHFLGVAFSFSELQYVRVYRINQNGSKAAVERLEPGFNSDEIEPHLFGRHKAADYQLSAVFRGVERANLRFRLDPEGVLPAMPSPPGGQVSSGDSVDEALSKALKTRTALSTIKALSNMETPERPAGPSPETSMFIEMFKSQASMFQSQAEMYRQDAAAQRTRSEALLDRLLTEKKTAPPWATPGLIEAVLKWVGPRLNPELLESLGAVLRGAPIGSPESGGWTPEGIARLLETAGPILAPIFAPIASAIQARAASVSAQAQPQPVLTNGQPALPAAPAVEAPMPKPSPPQPDKLTETMIAALRKPPEDRKPADLVRLLASITIASDGTTLLDQWAQIAMIEDETLARVRIEAIDPRLVDEATWGGVRELLQLIREQGEGEG